MNTLTLAQPSLFGPSHGDSTVDEPGSVVARRFRPLGGEPTLDDELVRVWEGLAARRAVPCPVCLGEMVPAGTDGAERSAGGRCASCRSRLT